MMLPPKLCINLDHVATLRQARCEGYPSLVDAIDLAERSGADGITLHLREDRRHVQDADLIEARQMVRGSFTLEMASTPEMLSVARLHKPDLITLVPEKRQELTTESGLDLQQMADYLREYIAELHRDALQVSLFVEPAIPSIELAANIGADRVELHTGIYSNATDQSSASAELDRLHAAAKLAVNLGLRVNAGHGLNLHNVAAVVSLAGLEELHIGHAIVSRAVFVGLPTAIKEIKEQLCK